MADWLRYSTPALTAKTYTRLRLEDGHEAVAKIDGAAPGTQRPRVRPA